MPDIVLHHLEHSRSHRLLWLLEELELDVDVVRYARTRDGRAPPELRAIHPLGKSPVVTLDGQVVAETAHIIETVLDRFGEGRLRPSEGPDLDRYRYFLHYAEGTLMPPLLVSLIMQKVAAAPFPISLLTGAVAKGVNSAFTRGELEANGAFLEQSLANHPWFAGAHFTAADIHLSFPVIAMVEHTGLRLPRCEAFVERIRKRPAFQQATVRGGPPFA